MIYGVKGKIFRLEPGRLFLMTDHLLYGIEVSDGMKNLLQEGDEVFLYTEFVVRENEMRLFGFLTEEEKNLFSLIMKVKNVGPKSALSTLSVLSPSDFVHAILQGDVSSLSKIPGVGKKTAERMILELKDRLGDFSVGTEIHRVIDVGESKGDVEEALLALGYSEEEIHLAIAQVDPNLSISEQIRSALQRLGRGHYE